MTDWAVELAENPNTYTPLGPNSERIVTDRYVLWMGRIPTWNVAQRFAMREDEIDEVIEEIRSLLRERGRPSCAWEIGSHATPSDLPEQLLARGFTDDEPEPLAIGSQIGGSNALNAQYSGFTISQGVRTDFAYGQRLVLNPKLRCRCLALKS